MSRYYAFHQWVSSHCYPEYQQIRYPEDLERQRGQLCASSSWMPRGAAPNFYSPHLTKANVRYYHHDTKLAVPLFLQELHISVYVTESSYHFPYPIVIQGVTQITSDKSSTQAPQAVFSSVLQFIFFLPNWKHELGLLQLEDTTSYPIHYRQNETPLHKNSWRFVYLGLFFPSPFMAKFFFSFLHSVLNYTLSHPRCS